MKDGIIKADGTSRLVRATLPATYAEFRANCLNGTQPLDILFNSLGWNQQPTFLNKANLLQDNTATCFGLGSDAVPENIFSILGNTLNASKLVVLQVLTLSGEPNVGCTITGMTDRDGNAVTTNSKGYAIGYANGETIVITPYYIDYEKITLQAADCVGKVTVVTPPRFEEGHILRLTSSGDIVFSSDVESVDVCAVGGGGGGGGGRQGYTMVTGGGGGGGGAIVNSYGIVPEINTPITVTIGAGGGGGSGANGGNGGTTTIFDVSAAGGKGGKQGENDGGTTGREGVGGAAGATGSGKGGKGGAVTTITSTQMGGSNTTLSEFDDGVTFYSGGGGGGGSGASGGSPNGANGANYESSNATAAGIGGGGGGGTWHANTTSYRRSASSGGKGMVAIRFHFKAS